MNKADLPRQFTSVTLRTTSLARSMRRLEPNVSRVRSKVRDRQAAVWRCADALDDMKISGVQLCLEHAVQGDGIMAVDGNDRVAVAIVLGGVQDRLRVRKN
jgi:ribosomal protein L28